MKIWISCHYCSLARVETRVKGGPKGQYDLRDKGWYESFDYQIIPHLCPMLLSSLKVLPLFQCQKDSLGHRLSE